MIFNKEYRTARTFHLDPKQLVITRRSEAEIVWNYDLLAFSSDLNGINIHATKGQYFDIFLQYNRLINFKHILSGPNTYHAPTHLFLPPAYRIGS